MALAKAKVAVIGGGAWGSALAQVLARNGRDVVLWMRDREAAAARGREHQGSAHAAAAASTLASGITTTSDSDALADRHVLVLACPAQAIREVMTALAPSLAASCRVVITAKGVEGATTRLMSEVLAEVTPTAVPLVLSGPSFAADVARGLPTAVTLAAPTLEEARLVAPLFARPEFRPYMSDDLIGVQIGGAVKNVMAIACGIVTGQGLGDSARAALVARAFAELSRLGLAMGARPETLAGLSGLGDLVLTCSSAQSRNFALGVSIGERGRAGNGVGDGEIRGPGHPLAPRTVTREGAHSAGPVVALARRHGVDMPIAEAVQAVLSGALSVEAAIEGLLMRPTRAEA